MAQSKGFDDESGHSTLPFEGGEEMDEDEDEPLPRPRSNRLSSSTSGFTFTEDHYNLLNGRIDSFTSTAEGLHNSMVTLQDLVVGMTSLLHALHSRLDAMLPSHPPPED
ncbi:berberine bridge enzyme-like 13 [Abeliophyllum distichum]|uniref:Berberine bridge enzyme-like 13 n=1 Tax=Abeliophyllum distichum TaxID=126358 RepID=A0ABD1QZP8_9LAMI